MPRGIAVLAGVGLLLASMSAAPAAAGDASAQSTRDQCVHDIDEGTLVCFDTFTEAIAEASGGAIDDAPAGAAAVDSDLDDRIDALSEEAGAQENIVLSISYSGQNHSGATLTSTGSATCTNKGYYYGDLGLVGSGWDYRIRSFKSYANCRITLYSHRWCTLANRTWARNAQPASLGTFDARAMSMRFSYNLPPGDTCL